MLAVEEVQALEAQRERLAGEQKAEGGRQKAESRE
jgi:hypothetical protein